MSLKITKEMLKRLSIFDVQQEIDDGEVIYILQGIEMLSWCQPVTYPLYESKNRLDVDNLMKNILSALAEREQNKFNSMNAISICYDENGFLTMLKKISNNAT